MDSKKITFKIVKYTSPSDFYGYNLNYFNMINNELSKYLSSLSTIFGEDRMLYIDFQKTYAVQFKDEFLRCKVLCDLDVTPKQIRIACIDNGFECVIKSSRLCSIPKHLQESDIPSCLMHLSLSGICPLNLVLDPLTMRSKIQMVDNWSSSAVRKVGALFKENNNIIEIAPKFCTIELGKEINFVDIALNENIFSLCNYLVDNNFAQNVSQYEQVCMRQENIAACADNEFQPRSSESSKLSPDYLSTLSTNDDQSPVKKRLSSSEELPHELSLEPRKVIGLGRGGLLRLSLENHCNVGSDADSVVFDSDNAELSNSKSSRKSLDSALSQKNARQQQYRRVEINNHKQQQLQSEHYSTCLNPPLSIFEQISCSSTLNLMGTMQKNSMNIAGLRCRVLLRDPLNAIKPMLNFYESRLLHFIKLALSKLKWQMPSHVQCYTIPSVLARRDLLVLAPDRESSSRSTSSGRANAKGKTSGITMALLSMLINQRQEERRQSNGAGDRTSLRPNNAPLALIVMHSWFKVRETADWIEFLQDDMKKHVDYLRVVALQSGSEAEKQGELQLLSGEDIVISTPGVLSRMLEKQMLLNLSRLHFLVLDDLDKMLEDSSEAIKYILLARKQALVEFQQENLETTYMISSIAATASHWTAMLESFVTEPRVWNGCSAVEVIGSCTEAAVRCKVSHFFHFRSTDLAQSRSSRPACLADLLRTLHLDHRVVVCAEVCGKQSKEEFAALYSYLVDEGFNVLLAQRDRHCPIALEDVCREWNKPSNDYHCPILLASDKVDDERLGVYNADAVIHYNLPDKQSFGKRLFYMKNHLEMWSSNDAISCPAKSYFVLDPYDIAPGRAEPLVNLLARSGCLKENIPQEILNRAACDAKLLLEKDSATSICPQIKAFARCHAPIGTCYYQHTIAPTIESECLRLPNCGMIKLSILKVESATCLWARLLEHRPLLDPLETSENQHPKVRFGKRFNLAENFTLLSQRLTSFLRRRENQRTLFLDHIKEKVICAWKDTNQAFWRVRILKVDVVKRIARAHLLDHGNVMEVRFESLLELPEELQINNFPPQAIEVYVCGIHPVDGDAQWSQDATNLTIQLLLLEQHGDIWGRILTSLNGVMWLETLATLEFYKASGTWAYERQLAPNLQENGLGIRDPEHVERFVALCRGRLDVPSRYSPNRFRARRFTYQTNDLLLEVEQLINVQSSQLFFLTYCRSPDLFYVVPVDKWHLMWQLNDEIQEHLSSIPKICIENIVPKQLVLAPYSNEACSSDTKFDYYRARVMKLCGSICTVFFVDFGDIIHLDLIKLNLYELPVEFRGFPAQAIKCALANCLPAHKGEHCWGERVDKFMTDFAYDKNNDRYDWHIQLISKKRQSSMDKVNHYEVAVRRVQNDVDMFQELVRAGRALCSNDFVARLYSLADPTDAVSPLRCAFAELLKSDLSFDRREYLMRNLEEWAHRSQQVELDAADLSTFLRYCGSERELSYCYAAAHVLLNRDLTHFPASCVAAHLQPFELLQHVLLNHLELRGPCVSRSAAGLLHKLLKQECGLSALRQMTECVLLSLNTALLRNDLLCDDEFQSNLLHSSAILVSCRPKELNFQNILHHVATLLTTKAGNDLFHTWEAALEFLEQMIQIKNEVMQLYSKLEIPQGLLTRMEQVFDKNAAVTPFVYGCAMLVSRIWDVIPPNSSTPFDNEHYLDLFNRMCKNTSIRTAFCHLQSFLLCTHQDVTYESMEQNKHLLHETRAATRVNGVAHACDFTFEPTLPASYQTPHVVFWGQDKSGVYLHMTASSNDMLMNVEADTLCTGPNWLRVSIVITSGKRVGFELELYENILASLCRFQLSNNGNSLRVGLTKKVRGLDWPRLQLSEVMPAFLRVNMEWLTKQALVAEEEEKATLWSRLRDGDADLKRINMSFEQALSEVRLVPRAPRRIVDISDNESDTIGKPSRGRPFFPDDDLPTSSLRRFKKMTNYESESDSDNSYGSDDVTDSMKKDDDNESDVLLSNDTFESVKKNPANDDFTNHYFAL